ncbi:MAG: 4-hydroxy-3-methylbut-2-enyl diphosphate reductase [Rikenellaceae bacterium]
MIVEIDPHSGFCFGVVRAIDVAEATLKERGVVFSLGDIVHNRVEMQRLESIGLRSIDYEQMQIANGEAVLIRAHGEPPSTYAKAAELGLEVIDATCPVVAKLQERVKDVYAEMQSVGGQVVLLGKRGHAEVVGLTGQVNDRVIVVENEGDLESIDFERPIYFLSQTTQSINLFGHLSEVIKGRAKNTVKLRDTICRRVSSREEHLVAFVKRFDLILFVSGKKSSNGKVLYELCRGANEASYLIEDASEIDPAWMEGVGSVGICGATSTPGWLMESVAKSVEENY